MAVDWPDLGMFPANALLTSDVRNRMAKHVNLAQDQSVRFKESAKSFLNPVCGPVEMAWRRYAHTCDLQEMYDSIRMDKEVYSRYAGVHLQHFCALLYGLMALDVIFIPSDSVSEKRLISTFDDMASEGKMLEFLRRKNGTCLRNSS